MTEEKRKKIQETLYSEASIAPRCRYGLPSQAMHGSPSAQKFPFQHETQGSMLDPVKMVPTQSVRQAAFRNEPSVVTRSHHFELVGDICEEDDKCGRVLEINTPHFRLKDKSVVHDPEPYYLGRQEIPQTNFNDRPITSDLRGEISAETNTSGCTCLGLVTVRHYLSPLRDVHRHLCRPRRFERTTKC